MNASVKFQNDGTTVARILGGDAGEINIEASYTGDVLPDDIAIEFQNDGSTIAGWTHNSQYLYGDLILTEISDPDAPSSNKGRLYVRDNGSGKSQLVIRFPTGAIQVIATEP
jgi:hypothetical protein